MTYRLIDASPPRGRPMPAAVGTDVDHYLRCCRTIASPPAFLALHDARVSTGPAEVRAKITAASGPVITPEGFRLRLSWWGGERQVPLLPEATFPPGAKGVSQASRAVARALGAAPDPSSSLLVQILPAAETLALVFHTRCPVTGSPGPIGEYGHRGTAVIRALGGHPASEIEQSRPEIPRMMRSVSAAVEGVFGASAEIEALPWEGDLLLLAARRGSPGPRGALAEALDEVKRGAWTRSRAIRTMTVRHLDALIRPRPVDLERMPLFGRGTGVSGGVVSGVAVLSLAAAARWRRAGRRTVLLAAGLVPQELGGERGPDAVVLLGGGIATQAAAWARAVGVPMVARVGGMELHRDRACVDDDCCAEGSWLTVDGDHGVVYVGEPRLRGGELSPEVRRLLGWADTILADAGISMRANADSANEARRARMLGGVGVGLCRTERMLGERGRRGHLSRYLQLAGTKGGPAARRALVGAYRSEVSQLFRSARGAPVTIRLLDPSLNEAGPLRLYGCRVGVVHPGIYDAQIEAIMEAAAASAAASRPVEPWILVPQVNTEGEAALFRGRIEAIRTEVSVRRKVSLACRVGAMVETPRGAIVAGELARHTDFLCFGTNDLTQYTLGIGRGGRRGMTEIDPEDPFRRLDLDAVLPLMRAAIAAARRVRPGLPVGVCGEHAGDPVSLARMIGEGGIAVTYLSCAPARLPLARLAAAQAVLR